MLFSEILRYRLIKDVSINKRTLLIALVTVVFIFVQINAPVTLAAFFTVIAPVIVLNITLSYIAKDGTLGALLLLRGVVVLTPVLIPVLPAVPSEIWALFLQLLLFVIMLLYRMFIQEFDKKRREAKEALWHRYLPVAAVVGVLVLFSMGRFPVFPSIVLTESMTGSLNRGSIALINSTFDEIREGDIIQFRAENNLLVVHRVVEIHADIVGEYYFITKGDANDRPDANPVRMEQITGVVFGSLRHIGMVRVWINQMLM